MKMGPFRSDKVDYSDNFWIAYSSYCFTGEDDKKIKSATNMITEKRFPMKNTEVTYRTVNYWTSLGLFEDANLRDNEKGWRKFSVVDLVWLRVLTELRKYGLSLELIKKGYDSLNAFNRLLEFGIFMAMMRNRVYLVFFSDGVMELTTTESLSFSESFGLLKDPSFLVISLNNSLSSIFPQNNFQPHLDTFRLTDKEFVILKMIRTGNYDEIIINFKDGKIIRVDTKTKHVGEIGKLVDIMSAVKHGDFTIKKQDGKIIYLEEIIKEKV